MAGKKKQTPGAGAEPQPAAEPSQPAEANVKLTREELMALVKMKDEAIQTLKRHLGVLQRQISKNQSVSIKWNKTEEDITSVDIKSFGLTGVEAANESVGTMVSTLVTLEKLGFFKEVGGIKTLPMKLKTLDVSELEPKETE